MKYIDAEKLKTEIERLYYNEAEKDESILAADAYKNALDAVEKFLDSLQQEQTEVDLEKEIDSEWKKCLPIDEGMGVEVANIHIEAFDIIARYFYELGLNARKEE